MGSNTQICLLYPKLETVSYGDTCDNLIKIIVYARQNMKYCTQYCLSKYHNIVNI